MLLLLPLLSVLLTGVPGTMSFSVGGNGCPINRLPFTTISLSSSSSSSSLSMGLFDGVAKAFSNQDFQSQDQRVRASHILIKDNDDGDVDATLTKIKTLLAEIQSESSPNNTSGEDTPSLSQVFATIAGRESACPSASKGGDLGWFGPKKMVPEFDEAIFGTSSTPAPPQGAIVGPVVTDFGCHIIYIAQRETDKTQIEEKLARIDPDAQ